MPELPDITIYVERLRALTLGATLARLRVMSPFVLRTVEPPLAAVEGATIKAVSAIGKRIAFELTPPGSSAFTDLFIVVHLMIAGRLKWNASPAGKLNLAVFELSTGALVLTEASAKKRASIHIIAGHDALREVDRGGIDVFTSPDAAIMAALRRDNHTIKRALTDPTVINGVGNAYSDEILHHARMSPFKQTQKMTDDEMTALITSMRTVLTEWIERLRRETGNGFPEKVTAFRDEMAVHGRYGKPCPVCGNPVQRIRYADNEANYCAVCQNAGRLLADRSLSQLLKKDWPKTLDDLEALKKDAKVKTRPRT